MAKAIQLISPLTHRVPDTRQILVSQTIVEVPVFDAADAPIVATLYDHGVEHPYRAVGEVCYGLRDQNFGTFSRDEIAQFKDYADIEGIVADINADKQPKTYFNDNYFRSRRRDMSQGMFDDAFTFVADPATVPELMFQAQECQANAAESIVVDGKIHSPCSGPVLMIAHASRNRSSDISLRFAHSRSVLYPHEIVFDPQDPEGVVDRLKRRYGGEVTIEHPERLQITGYLPRLEVPVDSLADALVAHLLYWFRNQPMYLMSREAVRAVRDLRRVQQERWPDTAINDRPKDFVAAFAHIVDSKVADATPLLQPIERYLGALGKELPGPMLASTGAIIDYLHDRQDLRNDLEDIAAAISFG